MWNTKRGEPVTVTEKEEKFNELVRICHKRVFNIAYRLTGNRQDAEDATQDAFLRVYRGLDDFRGESRVFTWIYRIAVNSSLGIKRKLSREYIDSLDEKIDYFKDDIPDEVRKWENDPEQKYLYDSLLETIRRECYHFMTFRLSDEQRAAYVLRVVLGFSLVDISAVLQIDKNTVKARLQRAKANLKKYFSNRCQWTEGDKSCACDTRIGFALSYAPDIINRVLNSPRDPKTDGIVHSTISKIEDIDEIYQSLPLEEHKLELLHRHLKGA